MYRVAPVHDVGKAERVGAVHSEWIRSDCHGKRHAGAGLEYPAKLPATCGPAQNAGKRFGAWNFPGVTDDYIVGLIKVRRPSSKPRIEEELTGEAVPKLIAIG